MGLVYAEIELTNSSELELVKRHIIDKDEVRRIQTTMLVDTGAFMMAINETIQSMLNLPFIERRRIEFANGLSGDYDVVGPVEVSFAGRKAGCTAIVLPGESEPLLGCIPLEEMGLYIHPLRQELIASTELIFGMPAIKPFPKLL
jgi:clan AA aspartic protease